MKVRRPYALIDIRWLLFTRISEVPRDLRIWAHGLPRDRRAGGHLQRLCEDAGW